MRTLTNSIGGMMRQEANTLLLETLLIEPSALRLANNAEDISVNGVTYTACGFELQRPHEKDHGTFKASLIVSNADRWLTPIIRQLTGEMTVQWQLVVASDLTASPPEFDHVEMLSPALTVNGIDYDEETAKFTLSMESITKRRFPGHTFNPSDFPEMF